MKIFKKSVSDREGRDFRRFSEGKFFTLLRVSLAHFIPLCSFRHTLQDFCLFIADNQALPLDLSQKVTMLQVEQSPVPQSVVLYT